MMPKPAFLPTDVPFPEAIIFDWDNTLVDTKKVLVLATERTFEIMRGDLERFKEICHLSLRDSFPLIFGDKWEEAKALFYQTYEEEMADKLMPLPGAHNLLHVLSRKNIYMAIISNKKGLLLRKEVSVLGWSHYFKKIIGSLDCAEDKPSALCVEEALADCGVSPMRNRVWFVGDTLVDYQGAINAGCFPIGVNALELFPSGMNVSSVDALVSLL